MKYFLVQERHIPKLANLDYQIHIYQRSQLGYFKGWYKNYLFHWHGKRSKFYIPWNEYEDLMKKVKDIGYHPHRYRPFLRRFFSYLRSEPNKVFLRANELLNTDPRLLSDRTLAEIIANESIQFFVKKWYWLHLPPFFYGFEIYLKEIMVSHHVPTSQIGQWIATLSMPAKLTANTRQEMDFLKLVLYSKRAALKQTVLVNKLQQHFLKYRYAVSAFGNEPFSAENLKSWLGRYKKTSSSKLKQKLKSLSLPTQDAQKKKKEIFSALIDEKGVKIVSGLLSGMAYIRERNKEALGKVLFAFGRFYEEAAKRSRIPKSHLDFYLLHEIKAALLENKKVSSTEIQRRRTCLVILSKHNSYKRFLSGSGAHRFVKNRIRDKMDHTSSELVGTCGNGGYAIGRVRIIRGPSEVAKMKPREVLVAPYTDHELVPAIRLASAIVTEEGGILAHAAVISREFNIPCVIGTKIATKVFKDGDMVEVDATRGVVRKIKV